MDIVSKTATGKVQIEPTTGQRWVQYRVVEWVWSPCLQVYRKVDELFWYVE